MDIKRYRKKPVVIKAVKWTGHNIGDILQLSTDKGNGIGQMVFDDYLIIKTLEGEMRCDVGDFVIKGIKGECYPCKPDIFEKSYELVEDEHATKKK